MALIPYNGTMVMSDWPEKVQAAQMETHWEITGQEYARIPYGSEKHYCMSDVQACHDCAVLKGQLHVPGCDLEQCPKCGGQAISCFCTAKEEEEEETD